MSFQAFWSSLINFNEFFPDNKFYIPVYPKYVTAFKAIIRKILIMYFGYSLLVYINANDF